MDNSFNGFYDDCTNSYPLTNPTWPTDEQFYPQHISSSNTQVYPHQQLSTDLTDNNFKGFYDDCTNSYPLTNLTWSNFTDEQLYLEHTSSFNTQVNPYQQPSTDLTSSNATTQSDIPNTIDLTKKRERKRKQDADSQARSREYNLKIKKYYEFNDKLINGLKKEYINGADFEYIAKRILKEYVCLPAKERFTQKLKVVSQIVSTIAFAANTCITVTTVTTVTTTDSVNSDPFFPYRYIYDEPLDDFTILQYQQPQICTLLNEQNSSFIQSSSISKPLAPVTQPITTLQNQILPIPINEFNKEPNESWLTQNWNQNSRSTEPSVQQTSGEMDSSGSSSGKAANIGARKRKKGKKRRRNADNDEEKPLYVRRYACISESEEEANLFLHENYKCRDARKQREGSATCLTNEASKTKIWRTLSKHYQSYFFAAIIIKKSKKNQRTDLNIHEFKIYKKRYYDNSGNFERIQLLYLKEVVALLLETKIDGDVFVQKQRQIFGGVDYYKRFDAIIQKIVYKYYANEDYCSLIITLFQQHTNSEHTRAISKKRCLSSGERF
uniref:Uncharacterized protein n=1 Tax=Panagrolaimus sp. PS1159 TaxID=55785 RepID=A0AC35GS92_9BILA